MAPVDVGSNPTRAALGRSVAQWWSVGLYDLFVQMFTPHLNN